MKTYFLTFILALNCVANQFIFDIHKEANKIYERSDYLLSKRVNVKKDLFDKVLDGSYKFNNYIDKSLFDYLENDIYNSFGGNKETDERVNLIIAKVCSNELYRSNFRILNANEQKTMNTMLSIEFSQQYENFIDDSKNLFNDIISNIESKQILMENLENRLTYKKKYVELNDNNLLHDVSNYNIDISQVDKDFLITNNFIKIDYNAIHEEIKEKFKQECEKQFLIYIESEKKYIQEYRKFIVNYVFPTPNSFYDSIEEQVKSIIKNEKRANKNKFVLNTNKQMLSFVRPRYDFDDDKSFRLSTSTNSNQFHLLYFQLAINSSAWEKSCQKSIDEYNAQKEIALRERKIRQEKERAEYEKYAEQNRQANVEKERLANNSRQIGSSESDFLKYNSHNIQKVHSIRSEYGTHTVYRSNNEKTYYHIENGKITTISEW